MLTIPGIQITVTKELVPRGLSAAGVLGIIGCAEIPHEDAPLREVTTLSEFRELFGAGSLASMPEVELAFSNGLKSIVCAALPATAGLFASLEVAFDLFAAYATPTPSTLKVSARTAGTWGNDLFVRFVPKVRVRPNG